MKVKVTMEIAGGLRLYEATCTWHADKRSVGTKAIIAAANGDEAKEKFDQFLRDDRPSLDTAKATIGIFWLPVLV